MLGPKNSSSSNAINLDKSALIELLRTMSLRERLVVCLRYADGLSLEEIAAVLNAGKEEVERMLERAVAHVRLMLAQTER